MAADDVIARLTVGTESPLEDDTLGELQLDSVTGVRVIAIRRAGDNADDWIVSPTARTRLRGGDVVVAKGTRTGLERVEALADPA